MTKFHNRTHDLFLYTNGNTFVKLEAKASKVLKGSAIDKGLLFKIMIQCILNILCLLYLSI